MPQRFFNCRLSRSALSHRQYLPLLITAEGHLHLALLSSVLILFVQERRLIPTPLPIVQVRATSGCILIRSLLRRNNACKRFFNCCLSALAVAPTVPTVTDNCGRTLTPCSGISALILCVQEPRLILTPLPIVQVRATSGCILIPSVLLW